MSGELYGWGSTKEGKLGIISSVESLSAPRMVLGGMQIVRAIAGAEHSVAITADGRLFSSGRKGKNRLGLKSNKGNQLSFVEMDCLEYQKVKKMQAVPFEISLTKTSTVVLFKQPDDESVQCTKVAPSDDRAEVQDPQTTVNNLLMYLVSMPDGDDKQILSEGLQQLRTQINEASLSTANETELVEKKSTKKRPREASSQSGQRKR